MGRRGPSPLPIAERIARGETQPRRLNFTEPMPSGMPRKPDDLSAAAAAVWDRVMIDAPPGMLSGLDSDVVRLYCEAVDRYVTAQVIYNRAPMVRRGWYLALDEDKQSGTFGQEVRFPVWVKNPMHQVVRDNAEMVRLLARELGFTPSARVNLHLTAAAGAGNLPFDNTLGQPARMRLVSGG